MDHIYRHIGNEALGLSLPIAEQGRGNDEYRLRSGPHTGGQICEKLNRLAQPHIIGEARTQSEIAELREPCDTRLLIRTQSGSERIGDAHLRGARVRQLPHEVLHPFAELHIYPLGKLRGSASGEHHLQSLAHGDSRISVLSSALQGLEGPAQTGLVDLDPLAFDPGETVGTPGECLDLLLCQRLAVYGELRIEGQHRIQPDVPVALLSDHSR